MGSAAFCLRKNLARPAIYCRSRSLKVNSQPAHAIRSTFDLCIARLGCLSFHLNLIQTNNDDKWA